MDDKQKRQSTPVDSGVREPSGLPSLESTLESARGTNQQGRSEHLSAAQTSTPVNNTQQQSNSDVQLSPLANGVPAASQGAASTKAVKSRGIWFTLGMVGAGLVALVLIAITGVRFFGNRQQASSGANAAIAADYDTTSRPLDEIAASNTDALSLRVVEQGESQFTVNGRFNLNGRMVVAGTARPANPNAGELWYQKDDNRLYFYDGTQYLDLSSIGTLAATVQQVVTSIQGLSGQVNITAGAGIAVNGTTISNSGVISIESGSAFLTVTDAGNGRYIITDQSLTDPVVYLQDSSPGAAQTGNINVTGTIIGGLFQGNGGGLTGINAAGITVGTLDNSRLSSSVTLAGNTFNGANQLVQLNVASQLPAVSGVNVTNLNANNVTTGTLGDARLSTNVTVQGNTFNGANQLVQLNGASELPAVSAANLTNLNATNIASGTLSDARLSTSVTVQGNTFNGANQLVQLSALGYLPAVNASLLTNLNATNIASGTLSDARLSTNVALLNGNQTFTGNNSFSGTVTANTLTTTTGLTVGNTANILTLQGTGSSSITAYSGAYSTKIGFSGSPSGDVVYNFDMSAAPGTYTICTSIGNCSGGGGSGVTTPGGTTNRLARFSGATSIVNSIISDDGTAVLIAPSSDTVATFSVQDSAANDVLVVDTTNTRVAVGQSTASYALDVAGDINSTTGLRVGGVLVCDANGCAASGGSGFYIQNGTSLQTAANFNVQSANASDVVGVVRGAVGQTADLFQAQDENGVAVAKITASGDLDISGNYLINGTQISSANLSDGSNLAKLDANQTFTGQNIFQATADSIGSFQIQNATGNSNLLIADTVDNRIGIGTATPGYTLDVNGDINIPNGAYFRMNGVPICGPDATCAPSAGSNNYIQNSTANQTANFNIQSASASSIAAVVRGASGQTANILEVQNSSPTTLFAISAAGNVGIGTGSPNAKLEVVGGNILTRSTSTDSTAQVGIQNDARQFGLQVRGDTGDAFVIRDNTASVDRLVIDANGRVGIGTTGSGYNFDVNGSANATTVYQNGNQVCDASNNCNYAPATGSTNYIHNGTAVQTNANLAIQSASAGSIGAVIRAASGQTANIQEWQDSAGVAVATVSPTGVGSFVNLLQNGNQVCDMSGNCAGTGGGVTTPGGTAGTIPVFTGSQAIGDSILTQAAGTVTAGGNITATGTITGANFSGNGSGLTSVNAAQLNGQAASYYLNASNINAGTLGDTYLSSNVALRGAANTFTLGQLIQTGGISNVGLRVRGVASQTANLQEWQNSAGTAVSYVTAAGAIYQNGNQVCDTSGNCATAGAAGGDLTGTYPNPTIAKLQGATLTTSSVTGGDLLLYNGSAWVNQAISGALTISNTGVATLADGSIANIKLENSAVLINPGTGLSGGGTVSLGSLTTLNLADTTVTAASYGSASSVGTFTVDAQGRLTAAASTAIAIDANQITSGTLTVAQGGTGLATTPTNGQLLIGDGTSYTLATLTEGSGILITNGAGSIEVGIDTSVVCTTSGNCTGVGGEVTTTGGTAGRIAKFTGSQTIEDSLLSELGSTVTVAGDLTVTGGLTAATLSGDGTNVTNVNAALLGGQSSSYYRNASNINAGTLADGRLSTNVTLQGNTFNGISELVQLDGSGYLPALNGSALTALNATNIASGTLADARLSSNVALRNAANTFTLGQLIQSGGAANVGLRVRGAIGQTANLQEWQNSGGTAVSYVTASGAIYQNGNEVCDNSGNCTTAGAAGGDLTGTYPNPTIAKLQGETVTVTSVTGGDLLLYNGTAWVNQAVSGDISISSTGVATIANGSVTNAKLANSSLTVTAGTGLSGGGSVSLGGSTTLNLANTTVTAASYGSASSVATFTVDAQGRLTAAGNSSIAIAASQITSGTLGISRGGTNATSIGSAGTIAYSTGSAYAFNTAGSANQVLTSGGTGAPTFQNISALLTAGTNIAVTGTTNATIGTVANPTFSTSVTTPVLSSSGTLAITPGGALTVGATGQSFTLQGTGTSTITANGGGGTTTIGFSGTPTGAVTYNFDRAAVAGTYTICTTIGNCAGTGSGVTTPGGTSGTIALFTGSQSIGNSILTQASSTITVGGDLAVTGSNGILLGADTATDGIVSLYNATNSNIVSLKAGATSAPGLTFTLPTADGASGQCIKTNASGALSFGDCYGGGGGGVASLNSLTGALAIQGTAGQINVNPSGSNITLNLIDTAVTAASYGAADSVATFTVDAQGRLTAAATTSIALAGSQITSGTVADARLSANVTLQGNTFNGVNELVQLDVSGYLPALNGSALTDLNASNVASGTLDDGRLSTNVALYNAPTANFTGTLQQGGNDVCTTAGNCTSAGAAGGDLTGTYPNPTIAKLQGATVTTSLVTGGNLLLYSGTAWVNQSVSGDLTIAGTGVATIANGAVTNAKLANSSLTVTAGTGLSGGGSVSLGGTTTLNLANTTVTPNSYGAANSVTTFTVNARGQLTAAGTTAIAIDGNQITSGVVGVAYGGTGLSTTPTNGQLLIGNGTDYSLATLTAGTGIAITNGAGSITVGVNSDVCLTSGNCSAAGAAGGDLTGTYPNPTIAKLQGETVTTSLVAGGDLLLYDGSAWVNQAISGDVSISSVGVATIANGAVTNAKLANSSLTVTAGTGLSGGGSVSLGGTTTLNLANTTVTPNSYGAANNVTTFTVDAQGRLTAAGTTSIAIAASQVTSGTLGVARGGTGAATFTAGGVLFGNGTSAFTNSGVLGNGELLIGDGSGAPTVATLTAGSGVSITNGAGSITIAADGTYGGFIQNSTSLQTSANFNIQSAGASSVGGIIRGAASQTADLQRWQDSAGTTLAGLTAVGGFYTGNRVTVGQSSMNTSSLLFVNTTNASNKGIIVQAQPLQTANLQEWQNSAGTAIAYVTSSGSVVSAGSINATTFLAAGSNTAATGAVRLANDTGIYFRNSSNTGDIGAISVDSSNDVRLAASGQKTIVTGALAVQSSTTIGTVERFRVGSPETVDNATISTFYTAGASNKGIVVQGTTAQTANLQEWQDNTGSVLASVDAGGNLTGGTYNGQTISSTASFTGTVAIATLGTADTNTQLCRNSSNQIATCSGGATSFVQGGNSFGATAVLGTNDTYNLAFETDGATRVTIDTAGNVGIGTASPNAQLEVYGTDPKLRLTDSDISGVYTDLNTGAAAGTTLFNISPITNSGTDSSLIRLFRATNTTGSVGVQIFQGNNTTNVNSYLAGNGSSYLNTLTGGLAVGTTNPGSYKLYVNGDTNVQGNLAVSGSTVITSGLALQNVTASTSILTSGTLGVARGGTGASTLTAGGVLFGNGTSAILDSGVLGNGQLLIGDGSGAPTVATLTAGTGVSITNGAGSITIAVDGSYGGSYIKNSTTLQSSANFNIQSASAGSVGGIIRGAASQTANLFEVQISSGSVAFGVTSGGAAVLFGNQSPDITTQNAGTATGLTIQPGSSSGSFAAGGSLSLYGGNATGSGTGGAVTIQGGIASTGAGGAVNIYNSSGPAGPGAINIGTNGIAGAPINIGTSANSGTINIATNSGSFKTVNIGGGSSSSSTINLLTGSNAITINSGTGNIDVGTTAFARSVNVGTGAAAQTVTVGSSNTTSVLNLQAGTGTAAGDINIFGQAGAIINLGANAVNNKVVNIGSTGNIVNNSTVNIANTGGNATQSVNIGSTASANNVVLIQGGTSSTAIQLQTGASGAISLANNTVAATVNIGTGATGVKTINIGGTAANVVAIANTQSGGSFSLGAAMTSGTINIGGTGLQTGAITIGAGTSTGAITIGSSTGTGTITLGGSSGARTINIGGTGANTVNIGNSQTGGSISLGASLTSGTINIGGTGAQTGTINLGVGTGAQSINLGTGAGTKTVALGSTASGSTTQINSANTTMINAGGGYFTFSNTGGASLACGLLGQACTITSTPGLFSGSGTMTLQTATAGVGTAGNLTLDVGQSASGSASVLLGTGAYTKDIVIGSTTGSGTTTLRAGSGGIAIETATTINVNGAASTPAAYLSGTWFTAGTSTTTKPQLLIQPSAATSNNWSTDGTGLGINAATGFTGNLIDLQVDGSRALRIADDGTIFFGNAADCNGGCLDGPGGTLAFPWNAEIRANTGGYLNLVAGGGIIASNTLYFNNLTTDISAGNNEDITVSPQGTGKIVLNGEAIVQTPTNSTTAFQVQNSGGNNIFHVDTSTPQVVVGSGPSAGAPLKVRSNSTTALQVYNTFGVTVLNVDASNKRVGIGSASTPQAALHVMAASGTDALFRVTDSTATAVDVFNIADEGAITAKNRTNSTSAFNVLNSSGSSVLNVDTTNSRVGIGTATPGAALDVTVSNASVTTPIGQLIQGGTGDTTLLFNNATASNSFYIGQDASNDGAFTINSSVAAGSAVPSTITHVQSSNNVNNASATNQQLAFVSNVTAGNTIIVSFAWEQTGALTPACSDSLGNTYAVVTSLNGNGGESHAVCYAYSPSGGANTVTVSYGGSSRAYRRIFISEYSGIKTTSPVDTFSTNTTATGSSATDGDTSGSMSTTTNGDLVYGYILDDVAESNNFTAGTGFTQRSSFTGGAIQDRTQSTAGSIASTQTYPNTNGYTAIGVAFKAQTTGGSVTNDYDNALFNLSATGSAQFQNSANSTTAFKVLNSSGSSIFNVDTTNSRVGIGTNSPAEALDVSGNIQASGQLKINGTGDSYIMGSLGLGTTSPQGALTITNDNWITALDNTGSSYVNMFKVNADNEVELGAALSVDGNIVLPNDAGQLTLVDLPIVSATAGTAQSYSFRVGSTNVLTVYGQSNGSGGAQNTRVAIGTSIAPSYKLQVDDTSTTSVARFNGPSSSQCTVVTGTGWSCTSDARLKTNITNISSANALDKIKQIQGVTYNWVGDPNGQLQNGFIAQAIQQVLPELVTDDGNGYLSLNKDGLLPYIVGAINEQQSQISGLQNQMNNQQSQINSLQNQVNTQAALIAQGSFANLNISGNASTYNLTVTGNAQIKNLTVTDAATFAKGITVNGHIVTGNTDNKETKIEVGAQAGDKDDQDHPASVTITGNDTSGKITINTGEIVSAGELAKILFANEYGKAPNVILTPANGDTAGIQYFVNSTDKGNFTINANQPAALKTYTFYYQIME